MKLAIRYIQTLHQASFVRAASEGGLFSIGGCNAHGADPFHLKRIMVG